VYVLSTERLDERDPQFREKFAKVVVGGFSQEFPFWTVPDFVNNLPSIDPREIPSAPLSVTIRVRENSRCATVYRKPDPEITAQGAPCTVQFQPVSHLAPSGWSWTIYFNANGWGSLAQRIREWGLLERNVSVYLGSLTVPPTPGGQEYKCEVNGIVLRDRPIIERDGIFVGQWKGIQYYETAVTEGSQRRIVRVLNDADQSGKLQTQRVDDENTLAVLFLNTLIAVTE
jgi:hypothetical protein